MSYLEFAYPDPPSGDPTPIPETKPGGSDADDPHAISVDEETLGVHYHTWRNIISRLCLAEKEGSFNEEWNPEKIPSPRPRYRYQDQNFIQVVQPLQTFRPRTLAGGQPKKITDEGGNVSYVHDPVPHGLKGIVKAAHEKKLKVKAVGTGHSFSDVATTPDFLVVTDDLDEMLDREGLYLGDKLPGPDIRHYPYLKPEVKAGYESFLHTLDISCRFYGDPDEHPGLVEFEAGIKIANLNDELWMRGWSLYNMGTYQGQSFIGAASTSTHGSGHKLPPLPDMIRSLVIVAEQGFAFRIEPTEGISAPGAAVEEKQLPDAEGFKKLGGKITKTSEDGVDFLIQDDDWFASALVNVGTFGIIYSVIIEVIPHYYLLETVEFTTWEQLRDRLANPLLRREIFEEKKFTARVLYSPHIGCTDENTRDKLVVNEIRQTTIETHPHKYYNSEEHKRPGTHICRIIRQYRVKRDEPFAQKWADRKKGRTIGEGNPAVLASLNVATEGVRHDKNMQNKKYDTDLRLIGVAILRPVSGKRGESFSLLFHQKKRVKAVAESTAPEEPACDEWYLNRNYRTQVIALFPGYGVELGFRTAEKDGRPLYLPAMERVLELAEQHWQEGRYMQSSPVALRLVKASNAYLSMQYSDSDEPTAMIELLNQSDTNGGKELFYRYERELFQHGARPHWGLDLSVTTGNNGLLANMYPKFAEWKMVYDALNASGTFENRFTDRMGLSK